jgi:hypothetical protein
MVELGRETEAESALINLQTLQIFNASYSKVSDNTDGSKIDKSLEQQTLIFRLTSNSVARKLLIKIFAGNIF